MLSIVVDRVIVLVLKIKIDECEFYKYLLQKTKKYLKVKRRLFRQITTRF